MLPRTPLPSVKRLFGPGAQTAALAVDLPILQILLGNTLGDAGPGDLSGRCIAYRSQADRTIFAALVHHARRIDHHRLGIHVHPVRHVGKLFVVAQGLQRRTIRTGEVLRLKRKDELHTLADALTPLAHSDRAPIFRRPQAEFGAMLKHCVRQAWDQDASDARSEEADPRRG